MRTPLVTDNPPGRDTLLARVGRYSDFRETMLARLADPAAPFTSLNALRTRDPADPTIALIDAFACICDVLSFYQEKLINEGYMGTAREPRSVHELARLIGYRPRAGVASSTFLAFTVDPTSKLTLAAGARAQSVPGAGETAQTFETSDPIALNGAWNALRPRLTRPIQARADLDRVALLGTSSGLKINDPLLLVVAGAPILRRVAMVTAQPERKRTLVDLDPLPAPAPPTMSNIENRTSGDLSTTKSPQVATAPPPGDRILDEVSALAQRVKPPASARPADGSSLARSSASLLAPASDAAIMVAAGATDAERQRVFQALAGTALAPEASLEVHIFKTVTAPAGSRSPPRSVGALGQIINPPDEWTLSTPVLGPPFPFSIRITVGGEDTASVGTIRLRSLPDSTEALLRVQITSQISYAGQTVPFVIDRRVGDSVTQALGGDAGDVTCHLVRLDADGVALSFVFAKQPISLLVSAIGNAPATVVDQSAAAAATSLSASEPQQDRDVLLVEGMLALQTGNRATEDPGILFLDGTFDTVVPGSWIAFDAPEDAQAPATISPRRVAARGVTTVSRTAYGQTARLTRVALEGTWIDPPNTTFDRAIRQTAVFAGSMPLPLAEEDIDDLVGGATLELDSFAPGLGIGRWLILTGQRSDLPGPPWAELAMIAGVRHLGETGTDDAGDADAFLAGEKLHTILTFAEPLSFTYERATLCVLANVAKATQGESVDEVLGSGSGTVAGQTFTLKKAPLTFVSAATPSGSASTLRIYVNGVQWHEVASFNSQSPAARVFSTEISAAGVVTIRFGDGTHGARLPTGIDNVRARYRAGLGLSGNVDENSITSLLNRPLGLKSVKNPRAASGGADAEDLRSIRRTGPAGLIALSRLVSLQDYQDFAATFAGVGKAMARRFDGPDGPLVHLTITGQDDAMLDPASDMWMALQAALDDNGDSSQEVVIAARSASLALIQADVGVEADRLWSDVEPVIRTRLLHQFAFDRRQLGQTLHASDLIAAIQGIAGVAYVDLKMLAAVRPPAAAADLRAALSMSDVNDIVARPARVSGGDGARTILPAEIVYISDSLPDMLVLNEAAS